MAGFEKDHYSLIELSERWKRPFNEIAYHAERERLQVQIWLSAVYVMHYVFKKAANGEAFPVQSEITTLTGYFVVGGDELRRIFRTPGIPTIKKVYSLDRKELYTIFPSHEALQISLSALEVSNTERARFEVSEDIRQFIAPERKTKITPKSAGRPSCMEIVIQHFYERAALGQLAPTLAEESFCLETWSRSKVGPSCAPIAGTIANKIRKIYNAQKMSKSPRIELQNRPRA